MKSLHKKKDKKGKHETAKSTKPPITQRVRYYISHFKTHSESLIGMLLNLALATPEQKCHSRGNWLGFGVKALAKT